MKNKKIKFVLYIVIMILLYNAVTYAGIGVTYYSGESIIMENSENLEILLNEVVIDTITSKVKNTILLKNTSSNTIEQEIEIPIENTELATTVSDLSIIVNNLNAKYVKDENGIYKIKIKAEPNTVKKIEIQYKTDNDLRDAKTIKYSLNSLKGKLVKSLKVDIIIAEEDIPLVSAIYPYSYTFENNTISVRYYNFTVNNLTKDIIVEKDTYNDLLYSREHELSDKEEYIVKNARNWITNGISIDYTKDLTNNNIDISKVLTRLSGIKYDQYEEIIFNGIVQYVTVKQLKKDNKISMYPDMMDLNKPLVQDYINSIITDNNLAGKTICVDYVESEGDKELYISKNISGKELEHSDDESENKYIKEVKINEWEVLRAKVSWEDIYGASKIIFVGMDIDGNKIDATEKEKIEYVNMVNADMYMRIVIYDGKINLPDDEIGYRCIGLL